MENIQTEKYWVIIKEIDEYELSHRIYNRSGQHFVSIEQAEEFLRSGRQIGFDMAVGIFELNTRRAYSYPIESNDSIIISEIEEYVQSQKELHYPLDTDSKRFLQKLHDQDGVIEPEYVTGYGKMIDLILQSVIQELEQKEIIISLPASHNKKFEIIAPVRKQLGLL